MKNMKKAQGISLNVIIIAAIALLVLIILSVIFMGRIAPESVGGERDDYGCLGPAGYSYDENMDACLRTWEISDDEKEAAELAVEGFYDLFGYEKGLTVVDVIPLEGTGNFNVQLNKYDENYEASLMNWTVTNIEIKLGEVE